MKRISQNPREHWQRRLEDQGFGYHTSELPYWDESHAYVFTYEETEALENATEELWQMSLIATQYVMDEGLLESIFHIPAPYIPYLIQSWEEDYPSIYGRFDFCYREGQIKLLEFNADTPTSLFEAAIIQWYWLQDKDPCKDQFNSIHEKLVDHWRALQPFLQKGPLYFSCLKQTLEDLTNTEYLRDCAMQAGLETKLIFVDDIGWSLDSQEFVDLDNNPIQNLFKLYPWEWMAKERFGASLLHAKPKPVILEPSWKMILSNKAILPILWRLFPDHPLLLPAFFDPSPLHRFAQKPKLSREGSNIRLVSENQTICQSHGVYGEEGFVYQQLFELPNYDDNFPVIGSWMIGQEPAGIGIRESSALITDNFSRFVPHFIE